jgi:predicted HAD superfamily Cof-like phosphohydrolase
MISFIDQVKEFHKQFDVPILAKPALPSEARLLLRKTLVEEEFKEFIDAYLASDLVGMADAIIDLHVVLSGTSLELGLPEDELFAEIHRSNMSKLWAHCSECDVVLVKMTQCGIYAHPEPFCKAVAHGIWKDVYKVHKRKDGKVIKSPYYSPADVKGILEKHMNKDAWAV